MFRTGLLETECWIGPGEVCATLRPLLDECEAGDARGCLAVGQYLADAPPHLLMANLLFHRACRIGDPAGCERLDHMEPGAPVACEDDPWACSWRAQRTGDAAGHEQACALGAAESCAALGANATEPAERQANFENACQLGSMLACQGLARGLSPDCEPEADSPCLPIDEAGAGRAAEMACAAGFTELCPAP